MIEKEKDINDAVDYLYTHGARYAEAKANRFYLEEFRKTIKADLMKKYIAMGVAKSSAAAEMEAYADESYKTHLQATRAAQEQEETLRWGLVSAQARIDVWRSQEASNRAFDKVVT